MIVTAENRKDVSDDVLNVHDAEFYSIEVKCLNDRYTYTFKAHDEWRTEEEFLFIFMGVYSCRYLGERLSYLLGSNAHGWYSLPCYPSRQGPSLPSDMTEDEWEELNNHAIYQKKNIRENIRFWEHELFPAKPTEKLFKVVFFLSTGPGYLEIECEKLIAEKVSAL